MANWVAGHTGTRFRCIVTHASLWNTESMGSTTDNDGWDEPMRVQNEQYSPHRFVADIQVPMLVIHGDRDYRVPIAQGQQLWYDLLTHSATPRDADGHTQHRYLYFPDEGHWILGRGNAQVWYETFLGFLDTHVRGVEAVRPATLG
ncbi:S9 family peptidase [Microbacterium sp. MPKO10]|uniref:alpha/beta hydrolase family protein n=1 Tax=Microbacterium sp. MPKO10 TaxID=2989818 RepID=UPI002236102D|nr:prolyl oligopeptidase family serine peptidase [Microbacterium sp. MPKO10]MCW4457581.1 prolyl oligopeptidase family serine peptidase [Microbacterium sp. MPKO10]